MDYKGWNIEVKDNNNKEYPYLAVARKGMYKEEKRGYSKQQAIDLIESVIDFSESIRNKQN